MSDKPADADKKDAQAAESRGWRVVDFSKLTNPPEWLAAAVYVAGALGIGFILYMLALGLVAFVSLGHEIVFGVPNVVPQPGGNSAPKGEASGSLTVFFTILGALIGGPLIIWRVITAHVQAQAARHQAETAREGHYTELFTKAVELLGATREVKTEREVDDGVAGKRREAVTTTEPNPELRLGAIYALGRVAHDSERDHWPIMQVLCAYVRNPQNSGAPVLRPEGIEPGSAEFYAWLDSIKPPRKDVRAALAVMGIRSERRRQHEASIEVALVLSDANLQGILLGRSYFEGAFFERAHLDRAEFSGAHLSGALFYNAYLADAKFFGAHLLGASFDGAHLAGASFVGAHLGGAVCFEADFSKAQGLDSTALASALGDASTKLPEAMERPAAWPNRTLSGEERKKWFEKVFSKLSQPGLSVSSWKEVEEFLAKDFER